MDVNDPNPIGWPTRPYWAFLAEAEINVFDSWDMIWGPDLAFSREVADGLPMAPDDLTGSVPPPSWGRRSELWTRLIRAVYADIGEVPEQDEYRVVLERYRTGPGREQERTLSLNYPGDSDAEFIDYLEDDVEYGLEPLDDEYDEFADEIRVLAGLTRGEAEAVRWVVSGNTVSGVDYAVRMAQALGIGHDAARKAWSRARAKVVAHWADEPVTGPKPGKGHHQIEGAGVSPLTPDGPRKEWKFG